MSFGFPAGFQFSMPISFKLPLFSLSSLLSSFCTIVTLHFSSSSFLSHSSFRSFLRYNFFPFTLLFVVNLLVKDFWHFPFLVLDFGVFPPFPLLLGSMVDSSKVRRLCPSLSFFFACFGASLGSFCSFGSLIENFVFGGSGLGLALADLLPLLCESVNWFKGVMDE